MTTELKQRLIGAVVITALAAIFIPMLFDDPIKEDVKAIDELAIPEPPKVAQPEVTQPPAVDEQSAMTTEFAPEGEPVEALAEDPTALEAPTNIESPTSIEATEKLTLDDMDALKDKKERERILHESPVEELVDATGTLEEDVSEKQAKAKLAAEKKAMDKLAAEQRAKEKRAAEKLAQERLAKEQIEYRKLAEQKAEEKRLANKKMLDQLAIDNKAAAKQQAFDDQAAVTKIEADKLTAEKATANTPAMVRWYVRVGSFSKEANALSLKENLRKQGYPAMVDVIKSADKGLLYRLRVGPELSKDRAEQNRQKMDAANNTKSILELE